jgi:hypothetical protein
MGRESFIVVENVESIGEVNRSSSVPDELLVAIGGSRSSVLLRDARCERTREGREESVLDTTTTIRGRRDALSERECLRSRGDAIDQFRSESLRADDAGGEVDTGDDDVGDANRREVRRIVVSVWNVES